MSINNNLPLREAVTVAEMARMLGMSRARFYQLQRDGVFPLPVFALTTKRPAYTAEQQQICLDVRRRNCGVNGVPICFYASRSQSKPHKPTTARRASSPRSPEKHADLLAALEGLGLSANAQQVSESIRSIFPSGTAGVDEGSIIRGVFQHIRSQNSSGNHRR
jgi:hypothetical protein